MGYDSMHRLQSWVRTINRTSSESELYSYDRAGNMTKSYSQRDLDTLFFSYYAGTNKLQKMLPEQMGNNGYDLNGNLISEGGRTFAQDYRNIARQVSVVDIGSSKVMNLTYDADLHRIKKVYVVETTGQGQSKMFHGGKDTDSANAIATERASGGGGGGIDPDPEPIQQNSTTTTYYIYTYDGKLVREYKNGAVDRDYLYSGAQRIGVSTREASYFRLNYFITDHLGSTRQLVDSTGRVVAKYDYYPYGGLRASTVTRDTKLRFTGQYFDDENVEQYYFGARYLNGRTYRFNSVDPAANKYPGWSPYAYCADNPLRLIDPSGETTQEAIGGFFLGVWDAVRANAESIANMGSTLSNPSMASQANMAMGAGVVALASDPVGVVGGIFSQIGSTWSSGDKGKGQVIGRVAGELGIAIALAKGGGALGKLGQSSSAATNMARHLGKVGEEATGITKTGTRIPSLTGTAKYRVPDQNTASALTEVKNVAYQARTNQMKDYLMHTQAEGKQFNLQVRSTTMFSKPMQELIDNGSINVSHIPGM